MADGSVARKPTATTEEVSMTEVKVKLLVDGIVAPTFGSKKQPKNGELFVTFSNWGFDMSASVNSKSGPSTNWKFSVKKLPSEIDGDKSSWKVDKGMVILSLIKMKELSWVPMLRRGLEQEESDSEDEK